MKRLMICAAALAAACHGPPERASRAAPVAYGEDWTVSDYWPGEWPPGFTVDAPEVVVAARARMHPLAPADIACPLPQDANYHPWNTERTREDGLVFRTATKATRITMTSDARLTGGFSGPDTEIVLKAGDELLYKHYIAEGFFIAEFEGREYELEEGMFEGVAEFEESDEPAHLWLQLSCDDEARTRAWILLRDLGGVEGLGGSEPEAFGVARDLD